MIEQEDKELTCLGTLPTLFFHHSFLLKVKPLRLREVSQLTSTNQKEALRKHNLDYV